MATFKKTWIGIFLLAGFGALGLDAQIPSVPLGLVTCQATASPPTVRAEGIAELTGDIVMTCTNTPGVGDPQANTITTNMSLSLNVNITNNIDFGTDNFVDAVLIVNENNCTDPGETGSVFGGCGAPDNRFQDPQLGRLAANNRIEWESFSLPVPGTALIPSEPVPDCDFSSTCFPPVTTLRITGVRGNVSQLGVPGSATFPSTQITAFVSINGATIVPVTNNVLNVGIPILGLDTEVSGAVGDQFGLILNEGFPNAFVTEGAAVPSASARLSESGYSVPGSNNGAGANAGTRFLIRLFNMAAGTTLSVPRQIEYGSSALLGDAMHLSLVPDSDGDGDGGTPTALTGQESITLTNGFGRAVYEVMDSNPAATESVTIPVTFGGGGSVPSGQISVSMAPISTVTTASQTESEPRFIDTGGDPKAVAPSPGAMTQVSARLAGIPQDDPGEFSVSIGGTEVLNGPLGSTGFTELPRGSTVPVSVSAGAGTTILDYQMKIECAGGGLTEPVTALFAATAPAPRTLSLGVPAAGGLPVDCSVLVRSIAEPFPTTTVDVDLSVAPDSDPGMFAVTVDGSPVVSGGDGAAGSTTIEQGNTVVVSQTALAGTTLTDYGTTIVCTGGGLPGIAAAAFQPGDVQARSVTFEAPPNGDARIQCDVRNQLGALPAAPPIPGLLTTCTATSVPSVVRSAGIAERTGAVVLVCTAPSGLLEGVAQVPATISVSLNVNTTSNIDFGAGELITDAVLVVNENNCTTPSAVGSDFTCGSDPRFQAPQYGKLVGRNRIEWQNFMFPIPGATPSGGSPNPLTTTLRIEGIRAQASQLGIPTPATFPSTQVTAFVSINGAPIPITNNVLNAAIPIIGLNQELTPGVGNDMELTLSEGFATAFKTQGFASFLNRVGQTEAGYFAPGSNGGDGASYGTRILLQFFGLDAGTAVSVPRQLDAGTPGANGDGLHLALVTGHDALGAGGSVTAATGNANVPLTDGAGVAVYEVLDTQVFVIEEITVPISFDSGDIGVGGISADFAALSTETEASAEAPEPRFAQSPLQAGPPFGPEITNPTISITEGSPGDLVTVTANVVDPDGVASVQAILRLPDQFGPFTRPGREMSPAGGTLWSLTMDTASWREGLYDLAIRALDTTTPGFQNTVATGLQLDLDCAYDFNPKTLYFPPAGGMGEVTVTWTGDCNWSRSEVLGWVSTSLIDDQSLSIYVLPNSDGMPRQGEIVIRDGSFVNASSVIGSVVVTQGGLQPAKAEGVGTYSNGIWQLDANGNGVFEPVTDRDFALGFPGAQHFVGDWDGDGRDQSGVYADGFWFLDFNGDDVWDGGIVDKQFPFGFAGATPVVGDWNGDGATDVGVYSNGFWFLDGNGDMLWDGGVEDVQFGFGWPGVEILVGDWNGDGRDKVGVFSSGFWFLDYDGDYQWDGGTVDRAYGWGWSGVKPIVGDWNGDGRDKAGAWINGVWVLDYDGDASWDGGTTDRIYGWGASNSTPVIGDWNNDGVDSAGAFLDGEWVLDVDGDALWDGGTVDQLFDWGAAGDEPVVGRW